MAKTYQITDSKKFNSTVSRLDVMVNNSGHGNILMVEASGKNREWDGQFGNHDFEQDYGFILINEDAK